MNTFLKQIRGILATLKYWKRALLMVWDASSRYTIGWIAVLVLQGLLPILIVYLTKYAIDGVVAAKDSGGPWPQAADALAYLCLLAVAVLGSEVLQHFGTWIRTGQAEVFSDHLADRFHQKAAEVDYSFYESPDYHDLMEQARGDASSKPLALLESIGGIVQNVVTAVGMAVLLFAYGWWLPLVLLSAALPALLITFRIDREYHRWWKTTAEPRRWTTYYDAMLTNSNAASEMRLFDLSAHFRRLYQEVRSRLRNEKLRRLRQQSYGKVLASVIAMTAAAAVIGWMALRVLYGQATLGDLGVFYQIFSRGQGLMGSLLQSVGKAFNNSLYLGNLFAFLDLQPKIVSPESPQPAPEHLSKGIAFRSITFTYPGSAVPVLRALDLFVPAGKIVALVGANGAGKSTLIKLLNRFYEPSEGGIELDGIDVRRFDLKRLRRAMSVLSQFPLQYHALAGENISLGDLENDDPRAVVSASRRAGSHDFIMGLPRQYDTLLGKWFVNGTELSGGEWQRLALARAYFREAPIIILDEPTSFMDPWSEADWFERFREMVAGKTAIVITHRCTIAMRADIIHVMQRGRIVESGTHRELIAAKGFYTESWSSQMREPAKKPAGSTSRGGSLRQKSVA